ncbi:hypothetical protein D623_10012407 [Myotis brandtii]|uniref:Uncharacterized protein n=1 Tax=Myotis brandtii TaxID=109478 RepID=S7ND07_MYOBR|nr:hypothetical protein D623_10012407 [Myotis brandtii]
MKQLLPAACSMPSPVTEVRLDPYPSLSIRDVCPAAVFRQLGSASASGCAITLPLDLLAGRWWHRDCNVGSAIGCRPQATALSLPAEKLEKQEP